MTKRFVKVAAVVFSLLCCCIVAACGSTPPPVSPPAPQPSITVNDSGFLVVDGVPTDVLIYGYDKNQAAGKSAYAIFCKYYPQYAGSKVKWEAALRAGTLKTEHEYSVVDGGEIAGDLLAGTAQNVGGVFTASEAVGLLQREMVFPLHENAYFSIHISGTLAAGNRGTGGGQILTGDAEKTAGRVYLGTNCDNDFLFFGVNIGAPASSAENGVYINFGWTVDRETLASAHEYEIGYRNGAFYLRVDGNSARSMDKMNLSQGKGARDFDGAAASREFREKVAAAAGQDFFTFRAFGANSHPVRCALTSLSAHTSAQFGYEADVEHPLKDKTVFFLGSSVTRGHGGNTDGTSFADDVAALTGMKSVKEAVSGTTLVNNSDDSYIARLTKLDFAQQPDAMILQLSTNDFNAGYDDESIAQAIQIIADTLYERAPNCKLFLYTCPLKPVQPYYGRYKAFVERVNGEFKDECGFTVIDLFNLNFIDPDGAYMQADGLHPTREGYASLFTPATVQSLLEGLNL